MLQRPPVSAVIERVHSADDEQFGLRRAWRGTPSDRLTSGQFLLRRPPFGRQDAAQSRDCSAPARNRASARWRCRKPPSPGRRRLAICGRGPGDTTPPDRWRSAFTAASNSASAAWSSPSRRSVTPRRLCASANAGRNWIAARNSSAAAFQFAGLAQRKPERQMRFRQRRLQFDRPPEFAKSRLRVSLREPRQPLRIVSFGETSDRASAPHRTRRSPAKDPGCAAVRPRGDNATAPRSAAVSIHAQRQEQTELGSMLTRLSFRSPVRCADPLAEVTVPKRLLVKLPLGPPNCVWLKRLKNSARTRNDTCSVTRVSL